MDFFIVSSGRPHKQTTWASLPNELREQTQIVIPDKDYEAYKDRGLPLHVTPPDLFGIGKTRQYIIDISPGKVVMMDDDLVFATRRIDEPTKFKDAPAYDVKLAFDAIDSLLNAYAHVSLATREGGNRDTGVTLHNTRMLRLLAYRADVLKEEGVRFDRLPVMEDFDVTLQLLRKGYENRIVNKWVQNQNGSGLTGGCSQYRTMDVQAEGAHGLKKLHPEFVTVVTKKTKGAWGGKERTDVRVQWKRALQSARNAGLLDPRTRDY